MGRGKRSGKAATAPVAPVGAGQTRPCPVCKGSGLVWGEEACSRCKGKGRVAIDSLPVKKAKLEMYIRVIHILAVHGPCGADEVYTLLGKAYPRPLIVSALRNLGSLHHMLASCEHIDPPGWDEANPDWSKPSFEWESWRLNADGIAMAASYCPECLHKATEHALGCSQPGPLTALGTEEEPAPAVIDDLLT